MQRQLVPILAVSLAFAPLIRAGSVDNRNNNSAEYIRSLSRNAATEGADLAIYNPAGAVRLEDGLHLSLSNQTVAKYNRQQLAKPNATFESDIVSPLYPTAFAVYKHGDWAALAGFSFPGGGGELDYKKGAATVLPIQTNLSFLNPPQNADTYLRSVYYGFTLGGTWAAKDWLAVSLAARALYARTDITVGAGTVLPPDQTSKVVDHMEEARGYTGILGVDVFPAPQWTLAFRFEGPTSLQWQVQKSELNLDSVIKDPGIRAQYTSLLRQVLRAPGEKFQRDLPATLGLGAGYAIRPDLRADLSFNYYFNTLADWGGAENAHDDGYEVSLGLDYKWAIPLHTSLGAMYTVSGANSDVYQAENPALNSYTLAAGAHYAISKRLGATAGWTGNFALDDDAKIASLNTTADLQKHVMVYALGLDYRAF